MDYIIHPLDACLMWDQSQGDKRKRERSLSRPQLGVEWYDHLAILLPVYVPHKGKLWYLDEMKHLDRWSEEGI